MILTKPYAFFIKIFKPLHLLLAILVAYLIHLDNKILSFLTNYIHSSNSVIGESIKSELASNLLFVIPIIIIVILLLLFGIMFRKKKKVTLYFVSIFLFVVIIIINLYASNFLGVLEETIVSLKIVKLIHDLVLINVILESVVFILFIIRGMGINFKSFDFNSDIAKLEINESDKEQFELEIDVDLNERKRKKYNKLRHIKYYYVENKFLINLGIISFIILSIVGGVFVYIKLNDYNKEGNIYESTSFSFGVDNTYILNTDYQGKKITDNYLIVVNTIIKSNYDRNSLYLKDFSLNIGETNFKPITKYSKSFVDLGIVYNEQILPLNFTNYLFIYEVPEKYITSDMFFSYNNMGKSIDIKLEPKELISTNVSITKNIGEEIVFDEDLGNINFKINEYGIDTKYLIQYDYCVKKDDCIVSYEYLKPSINQNFDKCILKLNVEYNNESDLGATNFYEFFSKFGSIYYKTNETWNIQRSAFEEIKSSKLSQKNISYIGINCNIINSDNIKLVFDIRNSKYEYIIK